jgi:hypothetical protein
VTFDQGIGLVREFGFPVFVAVWFMWRLEKRIDRLFELMTSHMLATALLAKSVDTHIDISRSTVGAVPTPPALPDGDKP